MNNVTLNEYIIILDTLTYNTITVSTVLDDNADTFYRFSIATALLTNELNNSQEFFYRDVNILICDLNKILLEIEKDDSVDFNPKNHLIYDISMIIKILKLLYK